MKNLILSAALGVSSLFVFHKPADAAYNANIYLNNECYQEIYVEVEWYDNSYHTWRYWSGYIPANDHAWYADFAIWGNYEFWIKAYSNSYTWSEDYVNTYNYTDYDYTFWCN